MRLALMLLAMLVLAACTEEIALETLEPQEIYVLAENDLEEGRLKDAGDTFAEVERLYPYSNWAKRAMIMSSYAYYGAAEYDLSRAAAQRFIEFYPSDQDTAYARYLIALGWYDQIVDVGRDQDSTFNALQALREIIERHPDSEYARDAELKFDFAINHLAGKEMEIGRYYLKRGHYLAAVNRFKAVVDTYETSSHTEEALHRMVEAYMALGLDEDARRAAVLLGHNFPSSPWYRDTFALIETDGERNASGDGTLIGAIWRQVVRGRWL